MARRRQLAAVGVTALAAVAVLVAAGQPSIPGTGGDRPSVDLRPVDVGSDAGVAGEARTWGARTGDVDGDGRDDLLLSLHKRGLRLLRNEGSRFVDITEESFPPFDLRKPWDPDDDARAIPADEPRFQWHRDRHDCLLGDVDGDGREDIYCTVGGHKGAGEPNPSELWLQGADGSFSEAAAEYGVDQPFGRGRFAAFLDANGDGLLDLFIGNQPGVEQPSPNRLFLNVRGERFRPAPEYGLDREVGADSAEAADFDGDGRDDLLICGADGGPAVLHRNVRGERFERVNDLVDGDLGCRFATLADVDGDDALDLVVLDNTRLTIWVQRDGRFGEPDEEHEVTKGKRMAVGRVGPDARTAIYVVQATVDGNLDDVLFVDRGGGEGLARLRVPQSEGIGQSVTAIDHNGDGRDAFVVMNGKGTAPGPIRMLRFHER